jgi:hypothetical protein
MPIIRKIPPRLLPDVLIRPLDEQGGYVVKNPRKRTYLKLGAQERFLLEKLDGASTYDLIFESFQERFNEPLICEDIDNFIAMAQRKGLVELIEQSSDNDNRAEAANRAGRRNGFIRRMWKRIRKQSPLYFRIKLINPDRGLNWLEPKTRWLFTPGMAILAALGIILATITIWTNSDTLITLYKSQFGWQMIALTWIALIAATICHEFGHGLACKRFGGEVHEMGVLWIFFMPCLYCNVSDAWLVPSKWRRVLISMAGTYVDLLIWVGAVIVWHVSSLDTAVNYMAWIVVTTCGLRIIFNMNWLMKMDGYYTLSDLLGVHNLRKRARKRWMEYMRWLLWGARRPAAIPDGKVLFLYGSTHWILTVSFIGFVFFKLSDMFQPHLGVAGFAVAAVLFVTYAKRYFKGSLGKDFIKMFRKRKKRALLLGVGALSILTVLLVIGVTS